MKLNKTKIVTQFFFYLLIISLKIIFKKFEEKLIIKSYLKFKKVSANTRVFAGIVSVYPGIKIRKYPYPYPPFLKKKKYPVSVSVQKSCIRLIPE